MRNIRSRRDVQIAYRTDTIQAILEGGECGRLRKQHQETIEALVEMRVLFRLEELQTKI